MDAKALLTSEEIQTILLQAEYYSGFEDLWNLSFGHYTYIDIIWLTPIHHLIFIQGNDEIGFQHIRKRHMGYFHNSSLQDKAFRESGKIDTPSHFRQGTIPVGDYKLISDQIFSTGQKANKNGCDSFTGKYKHEDNKEVEYRLVLIENTKIIVSLYPTKPVGNIKKPEGFLWHRAKVKSSSYIDKTGQSVTAVCIPYYNKDNKIEYSISFLHYIVEKSIHVFITVHDENGFPQGNITNQDGSDIIVIGSFQELPPGGFLDSMYQEREILDLERIIMKVHQQNNT